MDAHMAAVGGREPNYVWRSQPRLRTMPNTRSGRLAVKLATLMDKLMNEIEDEVVNSQRYIEAAQRWRDMLTQEDQKHTLSQLPSQAGPRITVEDMRMDRDSVSPTRKKSAMKRRRREMSTNSDSSSPPPTASKSKGKLSETKDSDSEMSEPDKKRRRKKESKKGSDSKKHHRSSSECKKKMRGEKGKKRTKHKRKKKKKSGVTSSVSSDDSDAPALKSSSTMRKSRSKKKKSSSVKSSNDSPTKERKKRGPSAYNLYVTEKKSEGVSLKDSRQQWKAMSEEAKKPWKTRTMQLKQQLQSAADPTSSSSVTPAPAVSASASSSATKSSAPPTQKNRSKSPTKSALKPALKRRNSLAAKAAARDQAGKERVSSQPNRTTAKIKPVTSLRRKEESSDSDDDSSSSSLESSSDESSPGKPKSQRKLPTMKYSAKRTGQSASQKVNTGLIAAQLSGSEEE